MNKRQRKKWYKKNRDNILICCLCRRYINTKIEKFYVEDGQLSACKECTPEYHGYDEEV